jgi:hypothetical protein
MCIYSYDILVSHYINFDNKYCRYNVIEVDNNLYHNQLANTRPLYNSIICLKPIKNFMIMKEHPMRMLSIREKSYEEILWVVHHGSPKEPKQLFLNWAPHLIIHQSIPLSINMEKWNLIKSWEYPFTSYYKVNFLIIFSFLIYFITKTWVIKNM